MFRRLAPPSLLALLLLSAAAAQAQQITIKPSPTVLAGEPLQIVLEGLPARTEVTVQTLRQQSEWGGRVRPYSASATFTTDANGRIDLATQAPDAGRPASYQGADLRGLFWSMVPKSGDGGGEALPPAGQVTIRVQHGEQTLATQTLTLRNALPEVRTRPAEGLAGAVFASLPGSDNSKRPALILLGGSEGGSMITRDAPVWASRGYAVLALPYYSPAGWGAAGPTPPELPTLPAAFADIPLERLEQARDWLAAQREVDATRIGVMGTSKGAEFVLLAAARMPWIKSVVAMVPSDVVWEGWGPGVKPGQRASFAWRGQPLPFVPYQDFEREFAGFATGEPVIIRRPQDKGRAAHPERVASARIAVEDIAAPVMVIGAHDDQVWDSGSMALAIAATRHKAGRETLLLVYREGGHALGGTGWLPTTQYNAGPMKMGGSPAATARAQAEAFEQTVAFLRRTLGQP